MMVRWYENRAGTLAHAFTNEARQSGGRSVCEQARTTYCRHLIRAPEPKRCPTCLAEIELGKWERVR